MERGRVVYPPVPLTLSLEDKDAIERMANRLIAETLHASEDFAAQGHVVDPSCWKLIKEKDNMVAYKDVSSSRTTKRNRLRSEETVIVTASPQNPMFYPTSQESFDDTMMVQSFHNVDNYDSTDERSLHHDEFTKFGAKGGAETSVLEKFRPPNVPIVFTHGSFPGTVDDMALAFLADTDERSRTRFNTVKDVVVEDVRILAKIYGPTRADPFRFLGVKWCSNTAGRAVSLVIKPRDYVMVEASGQAFDSKGVRFTYFLNHSIDMEEVPDFWEFGLVRTIFSTCHILRPHEGGKVVKAYTRGFLSNNGSFSVRLSAAALAEVYITTPRALEEAYIKKLVEMLHGQHRRSPNSSSASECSSLGSSNDSSSLVGKTSSCSCCQGKLSSRRLGGLLDTSSDCRLCRNVICHKCTVRKCVPDEGAHGRYMKKIEQDFCLTCYLEAKRLSARHVATATLLKASI